MENIFEEIRKERKRQDKKFGIETLPPEDYLMILGEKAGEANRAAFEHKFCEDSSELYRTKMIQVAAAAIAAIESYDRLNP